MKSAYDFDKFDYDKIRDWFILNVPLFKQNLRDEEVTLAESQAMKTELECVQAQTALLEELNRE